MRFALVEGNESSPVEISRRRAISFKVKSNFVILYFLGQFYHSLKLCLVKGLELALLLFITFSKKINIKTL
jgi:hypothetical protein